VSDSRGVPMIMGGFEFSDDEGGEVICVLTLAKLAGTGDRANGDSEDDAGECDRGVFASDNWSILDLCICDGLGIGTLDMGRGI